MHFAWEVSLGTYRNTWPKCVQKGLLQTSVYYTGTRMDTMFTAIQCEYSYLQKPSVVNVYDSYIR